MKHIKFCTEFWQQTLKVNGKGLHPKLGNHSPNLSLHYSSLLSVCKRRSRSSPCQAYRTANKPELCWSGKISQPFTALETIYQTNYELHDY